MAFRKILLIPGGDGLDQPGVRRLLAVAGPDTEADLVITEPLEGRAGALSQGDWRLTSKCPVPLLLVRSEATTDYRSIVAAVDPFHTHIHHGLVDLLILKPPGFATTVADHMPESQEIAPVDYPF